MLAGVFVGAMLVVGAVLFSYNRGKAAGEEARREEAAALAEAVRVKADYVEKLGELSAEWSADTETIDKAGIDGYVGKLKDLVNAASDAGVRAALEGYLGKWEELQKVYDGKDNEAIMEAFTAVKESAKVTGEAVQAVLDAGIEAAARGMVGE